MRASDRWKADDFFVDGKLASGGPAQRRHEEIDVRAGPQVGRRPDAGRLEQFGLRIRPRHEHDDRLWLPDAEEPRQLHRARFRQRALDQHHVERLIAQQSGRFDGRADATDDREARRVAEPVAHLRGNYRLAFDDEQTNR